MRRLFIVFGKLLGLLVLYWGLSAFGGVCLRISEWLTGEEALIPGMRWFFGYEAYLLLSVLLGLFLMFKTEKVADWLKLKTGEEIGKAPSIHQMLVTGLAFIGIYVLVFTIPSAVSTLLQIREYPRHWNSSRFVEGLITYVLQLVPGLVLVLRAKAVAGFIERRTRTAREGTEGDNRAAPRGERLPLRRPDGHVAKDGFWLPTVEGWRG